LDDPFAQNHLPTLRARVDEGYHPNSCAHARGRAVRLRCRA
jgi:hypothetical protein